MSSSIKTAASPSFKNQASGHSGPGSSSLHSQIASWLEQAESCFASQDVDKFVGLFTDHGYWRDILTLELDFNSLVKPSIKTYLEQHQLSLPSLSRFQIDRPQEIKQTKEGHIHSFITFETEVYRGSGFLILSEFGNQPADPAKALLFFTQIREVKGHEERLGLRRPLGIPQEPYSRQNQLNWLEQRQHQVERYKHGVDPTVLIIGGGHNGLMLAARLKTLGIDCLIVEKNKRIGDNWRSRYRSLCLHDPIWAVHFPYMPYPANWPIYIPKDKLANWFEHYAESMELDVWLETTVLPGSQYSPDSGHWTVDVQLPGSAATYIKLRPRYLVLATGLAGEASWPKNISNMNIYAGKSLHSSQFRSGAEWRGKRAVVVGACNSGHDIAADLWQSGAAEVTMIQRSSTYVLSTNPGMRRLLKGAYEENSLPTEDADLQFLSMPVNILEKVHIKLTEEITKLDEPLLESLKKVGFRLDPYPAGLILKYFRRGGGYYIDVGCSKLIAEQKIKLKQGKEVTALTTDGLLLEDGEELKADVIVFATGYGSMRETVRKVISEDVANKLGPIWGKDNQGEIPGPWRICGQPGFWLMGGNFVQSRCFSKHVANQILLQELNVYDKNWSGRAHDKVCEDQK